MKKFVNRNFLTIIGVFAGALAGYLYWHFIGCNTGTCAITSKPINSTVYGAITGGLLLSTFRKQVKEV